MKILEYINEYKTQVNNLMYTILVNEFGFCSFSQDILNSQNSEYLEENNKLWIAVENEEIIGTTGLIQISDKEALLKKVYVKETHRGKGIAQQLLNQCINYATNSGYESIYLETYHRLERAKAFYSKNGFVEYYDGYTKPQGDEIRYRLNLKEDV